MSTVTHSPTRRRFAGFVRTVLCAAIQGALLALAGHPALAQLRAPDAGGVARDVAPVDALPAPSSRSSLATPNNIDDARDVPRDKTPIAVRHVRVTGARLYPATVLEALVAGSNNGERTLADLSQGAARITRFYRTHGWTLAHAYLPAQSIKDGDVEIRVVEGVLSDVQVSTDTHSRLRASVIDAYLAPVKRGAPLNQDQADRALLLLSDLSGARLSANLTAGAGPGETSLVVHNAATPLLSGGLTMDNYGSRYTGQARVGGLVNLNSPFGYGERLTARVLASDKSLYYGQLTGQVPLGLPGSNTGLSVTHTQYLLGSDFAALDARGRADVVQWSVAYALLRSVPVNVIGQFTSEYRDLFDEVGATSSDTHKRALHQSFNLLFSGRDDLIGLGSADTQAALRLGEGTLTIRSQPAAAIDAEGARSAGHYETFNLDLQRNQQLGERWTLLLSAHAQLASRNLDSYQKFVLGGPGGVRAYPAGEGSGDEGWLTSAELSYKVNAMLIPSVFYDLGGVAINKHPYLDGANSRVLRDYGLGVRGSRGRFAWSVALAFRGAQHAQAEPDSPMRGWAQLGWTF